jgi:ubiquinone/menaquinone biosynthesis C-methylase UbiE
VIDAARFARLVTDAVVRRPALWRLLRRPLRTRFDALAPTWETRIGPHHLWALELALADVPAPGRILDLGTGTGFVARALAERVTFEVADAAALPCADGEFELVVLSNMIPFFDELARVTASGGFLALSFSRGPETPIYVPSERLRRELGRRGFAEFAEFSAPPATALRATRR